jgi:hypothetical protein
MNELDEIRNKSDYHYTYEEDFDQMEEECAELILAIKRYKRGRCSKPDVLEEMCDVQQLIEKFVRKEYFGNQEAFTSKERCKYLKMEALIERDRLQEGYYDIKE